MKLKILLTILMIFFVSSCVGVIEDTNKKNTSSTPAESNAKFDGAYDGIGVSHNKISVRFKPAVGGSGEFTYHAYLNGNSSNPANSKILQVGDVDSFGYANIEIDGLKFNSRYNVNIKAEDIKTKKIVDSVKFITVWTLDSFVPNFDGVKKVENLGGLKSMTQLKVSWAQAQVPVVTSGDAFSTEHNISGYNVYYTQNRSELDLLAQEPDLFSVNLASDYPSVKVSLVNDLSSSELIVGAEDGHELVPNKEYYFLVRARQSSNPPKYEYNQHIISKKTLGDAAVDFAGITSVTVPASKLGFSRFNVTWQQCVGCSQYNVYAVPKNIDMGSIHPNANALNLIETITNMSITQKTIATSLSAGVDYKIYMIACRDTTCGWNGTTIDHNGVKGLSVSKDLNLAPPLSQFIGSIPEPQAVAGVSGLTSLQLSWNLDTFNGYYSFLKIYQVLDKNAPIVNENSANLVRINQTFSTTLPYLDLTSLPLTFDSNLSSYTIRNLVTDQEYCFLVLPFIGHPDISSVSEYTLPSAKFPNVVCGMAKYNQPIFGDLSLYPSCSTTATSINLQWTHPESPNLFSNYEIFQTSENVSFAFEGASGAWNNHDVGDDYILATMVSNNTSSVLLENLAPNTTYGFGINTYYYDAISSQIFRKYPSVGAATKYCKTNMPTVIHGGWAEIFAVGPKINGLVYNQKRFEGFNHQDARAQSLVEEFLLPDQKIPYEWAERANATEVSSGFSIGTDGDRVPGASNSGIVRIVFNDFQLANSPLKVSELTGDPASFGYKVYRIAYDDVDVLDRPGANWENDIRNSDNGSWSNATELRFQSYEYNTISTVGAVDIQKTKAIIAYSSPTIQSNTANSSMLTIDNGVLFDTNKQFEIIDYPPANGKTYFYKVVAIFGGVASQFEDSSRQNVLEVIVPPDNMSLVHRWASNLEACKWINRGVGVKCKTPNTMDPGNPFDPTKCSDLDNHYRCEFNGVGSISDQNSDGEPDDPQSFDPLITRYLDYGSSYMIDRFELGCNFSMGVCPLGGVGGNCINTGAPNNADAAIGAVFYNVTANTCHVKTGAATWTAIDSLTTAIQVPTFSNNFLSNNAYLPPINVLSQTRFWSALSAQTVSINAQPKTKRLSTRRETFTASTWSWGLVSDYVGKNESGFYTYTQRCNSNVSANVSGTDFTQNTYPNGTIVRTGSNGLNSSSFCVSKYGLQDHVGNVSEINAEIHSCLYSAGATVSECTFSPQDSNPSYTTFIPADGSVLNSVVQKPLKNHDGLYLSETGGSVFLPIDGLALSNATYHFSIVHGIPLRTLADDDNRLISMHPTPSVYTPIKFDHANGDSWAVTGWAVNIVRSVISDVQGSFGYHYGRMSLNFRMITTGGVSGASARGVVYP